MQSDFDPPTVTVGSLRALPSEGLAPRFEIGLHIVNPNRTPLELQGIAYTLMLDGHKILTGVASDLPIIDGYSEGDVTLKATASLIESIGFFKDLATQAPGAITYQLDAKLDLGGLRPAMRVNEKGKIDLTGRTP
jgi:LEA14-like dessication related protein